MPSLSEQLRRLRAQIDNGKEPSVIRLVPTLDGPPVVRIDFHRGVGRDFSLDEAVEVTDEPEKLQPGLLVALRMGGRRSDRVEHVAGTRIIHGFHDRELERRDEPRTIADYTALSEGFINETMHPADHLVTDRMDPMRYFLFPNNSD